MQSPAAPGSLDRFADAPLWQQLSSALREEIDEGRLRPDQALPSESELINRYGVSRTVVREALADLVRAGLIYKVRARGSFVSPRRPELKFVGSMMGSSADLEATGRIITTKVINFETDAADAKLAEELQIAVGEPVIRLRRLRFVDTAPWLLVDTVLPEQRFPNLARANLENQSLYDHLRRHYGVHPSGADRWISAVNPSVEDAELLQLRPEDPILAIDSIAWDAQGVPFERYHALHRSDGNRFYLGIR
ncbi:HTH-type transcriptional repressor NagR [Leucobacter aridicollis]|uniref:GntR family transcriptional regulator n=1 Tax=Leucobacter aridicollis TaxID=283878 RepID=A0A852R278_9MICO|nr:GntR family transcriptional regulator [Leucobacter aridicollis]MBL3681268.1 GntR family transcriptional regulator [Leucobacter aridicollis]MCS3427407.1 GntR family transcriptional regulator [Leucobacter aridicollis]NYD27711.1 GntR family transcriptional regulator [Leucobacter aridicollis]RKQ84446.1 GntR family transcriptional regulator [Mycolicibacterium mucogenicum 261Sha1.1M5]